MKKIFTIAIAFFLMVSFVRAQEYKVAMNTGKLVIQEVDQVDIEGYNGSEVIFSTEFSAKERPERAKGLQLLNSMGLEDNSGIGLSIKKEGNELKVAQISSASNARYIIKVPKGVTIYYEHSTYNGKDLNIKNVTSEIEVSAHYNKVKLADVTGPMAIKTIYGRIEATFASLNQENSISLYSVYDFVDVTLPASAKADVMMSTPYGEMFTDMDLKIGTEEGEMKKYSSKKITGKLNGGGVGLNLKSSYKNIYLRKK